MENINILKVSLDGGIFLKTSFKEMLPDNDERLHSNVKCSAPVHEDLRKAFNAFIPHLALICEEITQEQFIASMPDEYDGTQPHIMEMGELVPAIKSAKAAKASKANKGKQLAIVPEEQTEWVEDFDILNFEFRFTNGIAGIILTGQKKLSTGKWMGIGPTPIIKENDPDYKNLSMLFEDAELLKYEVSEYIINHKYAPPRDPELDFGDGTVEGKDSLFNIKPATSSDDDITDVDFEEDLGLFNEEN